MNTPPEVKKLLSLSRFSKASLKEPQTWGTPLSSSADKEYKSLSNGFPGSILFLIPSIPAINIEAKVKYGFPAASGNLTSTLFPFGFELKGILQLADLFLAE
ncbi:MAG: hypothetical protein RL704_329 [Pseudomonadota bacterium]